MDWEEKFKEFKNGKTVEQLYKEQYGPVVGPRLINWKKKAESESNIHLEETIWRAELRYRRLQEFFNSFKEEVPQWIQEDYGKDLIHTRNYLSENLKSHDWRGLWKALQKYFGENAGSVEEFASKGEKGLSSIWWTPRGTRNLPTWDLMDSIRDENSGVFKGLQGILKFYGYFISYIKDNRAILLEPEWPDSAEKYVYKICGGIAYTIVSYINIPSIKIRGLKCRNGDVQGWKEVFKKTYKRYPTKEEIEEFKKQIYRKFPERIYFCAFPSDTSENSILDSLENVAWNLGRDWSTCGVYKINLKGKNIGILRDPSMRSENAFFTYENIPKQLLTLIKEPERIPDESEEANNYSISQ